MDWMRLCFNMFLCVFAAISLTHSWLFLTVPFLHITPNKFERCSLQRKQHIKCKNPWYVELFQWMILSKTYQLRSLFGPMFVKVPPHVFFQNTLVVNQHGDHNSQIRRVVPLNKLNFWNHPSCDHHFLGSMVQKPFKYSTSIYLLELR